MMVAQEFGRADRPIELLQKNPNLGSSVGPGLPSNSINVRRQRRLTKKTLIRNGVGFVIKVLLKKILC